MLYLTLVGESGIDELRQLFCAPVVVCHRTAGVRLMVLLGFFSLYILPGQGDRGGGERKRKGGGSKKEPQVLCGKELVFKFFLKKNRCSSSF